MPVHATPYPAARPEGGKTEHNLRSEEARRVKTHHTVTQLVSNDATPCQGMVVDAGEEWGMPVQSEDVCWLWGGSLSGVGSVVGWRTDQVV